LIPRNFKAVVVWLLLLLFVYLGLYTWNARTGYLDRLAAYTGMEFVGWVLAPGQWVHDRAVYYWSSYISLMDAQVENRRLRRQLRRKTLRLNELRRQASEIDRLRGLLRLSPPEGWSYQGARVLAHRLGPNAALQTIFVDKGSASGITRDTPVLIPDGVIGRVYKVSPHYANILLLTDPNSNIPVLGHKSRTNGIVNGQGPNASLELKYVPQNAPLHSSEMLITSGLSGIFPKGLPVANVASVEQSELSLFKQIRAEPLVNPRRIEEVLLLQHERIVDTRKEHLETR
jgi:rod shape-determining protein MreC